ncbi:hypothetical protein [Sagittula sp. MA-2]|jgi:hypothetical protein|uniref:hypothetical protein n=1 Tax=Sagittula sp. MA-2 TaxID=3048007 RepID=UPI0024C32EE0|nr:hypothetical protein [Sagittula sp. MA-2]WHZ33397.1 hypothetical protein QNI11_12105 [Sagittula sp. MA-2]
MRSLIIFLAAAFPAAAQDTNLQTNPAIVSFNGYSLSVVASMLNNGPLPNEAFETAQSACASVGKEAHLQYTKKTSTHRMEGFFVCLVE